MKTPYDDVEWKSCRAEFEAIATALEDSDDQFFGKNRLRDAQIELNDPNLSPIEFASVRAKFAIDMLNQGDLEASMQFVDEIFATYDPVPHPSVYTLRALVNLRRAEVMNCIDRHNAECCIFPIAGGGQHELDDPAKLAMADYIRYFEINYGPDDELSFEDLEFMWLLNLTAMQANLYPDGIPERFRLPESAWTSEEDLGRFVDIAGPLGIDDFNLCGGSIVDDFNNDGFLDLVTSTFDLSGSMRYYSNNGYGSFTDKTESSKASDQLGGLNCIQGDYDNDGDPDVLILRGAWFKDNGRMRNSLLRYDADRDLFQDVTKEAKLATPAQPTQTACWIDYDNDGDLDLYMGNESRREFDTEGDYPCQLFRNDGDGRFTDIAPEAGVTNDRFTKGVTAGDFDNDGWMDLYVSNNGRNRLYHNNGDGTFSDVASSLNVMAPEGRSFATWFWDYNNDGWLDIFVAAYDATISDVCADYLGREFTASPPALYRNNANGSFTNVYDEAGLNHPWLPMGAGFGDLDNDGFQDFYLATGEPNFNVLMPNVMMRNQSGQRFVDVTFSGGFGHLQKGHGVSFADLDHDGDQDIHNQIGGMLWGDAFHNALFYNPGHGNRFIVIDLEGVRTNRMAFGA
ncbi:MAG: VCBS repeat-containing protein, partial [Planctomycetota bacterium]|nr:VCBS repeat-containing protein [Planctomycetota bacterium]